MGAGSTGSGGRGTQQRLHLIAGFESTYSPLADLDCFDTTGHGRRRRADLDEVRSSGVDELRYPLLWHRIETEPGRNDWRATDAVLGHLRDAGLRPVVDLDGPPGSGDAPTGEIPLPRSATGA